ncbi:MAG: secreted protein, partial [Phycisphaerales bacterium]|nr:secreted protein [Phycisphaerales bacterium]
YNMTHGFISRPLSHRGAGQSAARTFRRAGLLFLWVGCSTGCQTPVPAGGGSGNKMPFSAPDVVTADPKHATLVFENDRVRIVRLRLPAHEMTPMHSHPDRVVVYLTDVKVRISLPDGSEGDADVKGGTAYWSTATVHAGENTSDQPWEIVEVELKSRASSPADK